MKYQIKDNVSPTNLFMLEVLFMHGDAEGYTTKEYEMGIDANNATPAIEFFQACEAHHPHGMAGDDGYWEVPGYSEDKYEIPANSEYCDGHASIESIELFWYSASGVKHEVSYESV